VDSSARCPAWAIPVISKTSALRIAILRGGALGDIVLTLPILQALRAFYPGCFITFFGPYPQATLAAGYANRLVDLNSVSSVGLFNQDAVLADAVIDYLRADLIISYLSDPRKVIQHHLLASTTPKFLQGPFRLDLERRPAVEQLAKPLRVLGIDSIDPVPRLIPSPGKPSVDLLAIHPGSGSPKKNWPLNHWARLLARLTPSFANVLLVSGEADSEIAEAIEALIPADKFRSCANRSLSDLVAELSQATLFIGHDSGVTHLAGATGIRTVALFGPTDPVIWAPNGDHVTVIQSPDRTMTGLSVETVLENLRTLDLER
jgi:heptosyltransferase III